MEFVQNFGWFFLALAAMFFWSGSDLFSKIGCMGEKDRYAYLKMITAVGVVMGLHACYQIFVGGVTINGSVLLTYLPVSALYIVSMAMGYLGLHYIELSVSSPICNSSGAIVAVLTAITVGIGSLNLYQKLAVVAVCFGVIGLGFVEAHEDEELRRRRQEKGNRRYAKSALALALPILYCALDAVGTFADNRVLETLDEDSANVAYELTFLVCGLVSLFYVAVVRRQKFTIREETPKYIGAVFETAGQFAYIYAIADTEHLAMTAPMISAYCLLSR